MTNKSRSAKLTQREVAYLLSLIARERAKFENEVEIGGDNVEGAKKMLRKLIRIRSVLIDLDTED